MTRATRRSVSAWLKARYRDIGVTFEDEVSIRLGFKILLEVGSQSTSILCLTGSRPRVWDPLARLSRREVNTVQCEPGFQALSTGGGGGFSTVT